MPIKLTNHRFCTLFTLGKGLNITKENLTEFGIPCVNYGQIHSKYGFEVIPERHILPFVSEDYLLQNEKALIYFGDFIFADTSEDITGSGNFTYLNSNIQTFAGYHTIIARPKKELNYRYIAYYFDSNAFRQQIQSKVKGVKVYSITNSILKNTILSIPPLAEQQKIVAYLDKITAKIDIVIGKIEQEISLLGEYRTRLISDVVTGKINISDFVDTHGRAYLQSPPPITQIKKTKK